MPLLFKFGGGGGSSSYAAKGPALGGPSCISSPAISGRWLAQRNHYKGRSNLTLSNSRYAITRHGYAGLPGCVLNVWYISVDKSLDIQLGIFGPGRCAGNLAWPFFGAFQQEIRLQAFDTINCFRAFKSRGRATQVRTKMFIATIGTFYRFKYARFICYRVCRTLEKTLQRHIPLACRCRSRMILQWPFGGLSIDGSPWSQRTKHL